MLHTGLTWIDPSYYYPNDWRQQSQDVVGEKGGPQTDWRVPPDITAVDSSKTVEPAMNKRRPMSAQERRVHSSTIARMREKSLKLSSSGQVNSTNDLDLEAVKEEVARQPRPQTAIPSSQKKLTWSRSLNSNIEVNQETLSAQFTNELSVETFQVQTPVKCRAQSARNRRPVTADCLLGVHSRGPDFTYYDRHARCFLSRSGYYQGPLPEEKRIFLRYGPLRQDWQDDQDSIDIPWSVAMATDDAQDDALPDLLSRRPQTAPSTVSLYNELNLFFNKNI